MNINKKGVSTVRNRGKIIPILSESIVKAWKRHNSDYRESIKKWECNAIKVSEMPKEVTDMLEKYNNDAKPMTGEFKVVRGEPITQVDYATHTQEEHF